MRRLAGMFLLLASAVSAAAPPLCAQGADATAPTPAGNAASVAATAAPNGPKAPQPTPSPLSAATGLYREGKFGEAEAAYQTLLKEEPKSVSAYVGLMRTQLKQKRLPDAAASLAKAMEIAPKGDEVQVAQAELLFRQGRITEAQDILTPIVKANTSEARAYMDLGRIYWVGSYFQHAKLLYDVAHKRDKDDPDIRKTWMSALSRKERLAALKEYLSGEGDDEAEEREHLHTSLV